MLMTRRNTFASGLIVLFLLLSVCSSQNPRSPQNYLDAIDAPETNLADTTENSQNNSDPSTFSPHIEVIATNLNIPWGITFTTNGRVFLTERARGVVSELIDGKLSEIQKFPAHANGEGGLLGIAASPDFANDSRLFVYYTTRSDNRVASFQLDQSPEIILSGIPSAAIHNGGRLAFGPDNMLYIATGDSANPRLAQDLNSLAGKILRLHPDGSIPDDNPFPDSPIYALGFRNVQGLAWDQNHQLYATEFGPQIDDEINHVQPGKNYGWPEVTGNSGNSKFTNPIAIQQPRDASWSGITFLRNASIPAWEHNLLAASLRGQRLWRFTFDSDGTLTDQQSLLQNEYGRLRAAVQAPDGSLWILTNNRDGRGDPIAEDDRILRLSAP